jgi:hypothetical protein
LGISPGQVTSLRALPHTIRMRDGVALSSRAALPSYSTSLSIAASAESIYDGRHIIE